MVRKIPKHNRNKLPKIVTISTEYECQYCQHRHTKHRYAIVWLGHLLFKLPIPRPKKTGAENND